MDTQARMNTESQSEIGKAANDLLNDGKKLAQAIYEDGLSKVDTAEANVKEYSDELLKLVQKNPLASVLVAGGVGFLLSMIMKK